MRVPECINMRKLKMKIFEFQTICRVFTIIRAQIENWKLKNYESARMYKHEKLKMKIFEFKTNLCNLCTK